MDENKLSEIYDLSTKIFDILKKEYEIYLSSSKKEFLSNLDISKFYKVINKRNMPSIFYIGDTYYLNTYYNLDNILSIVPFLCLSSLVTNLNPLKIGLIEEELLSLKDKYNLDIAINYPRELEVAKIVSSGILNDIPFKIIFKDSDTEIVNYLQEEINSSCAFCYYNVSKQMKKIRVGSNYFNKEDDIDYSLVIDYLYDFIGHKVK